jgi:caffeoyl-CoA O-methyltransferase
MKDLELYIENHSTPPDSFLVELERKTYTKFLMPRMLAGHIQGKVLEMITYMLKPVKILEIGTFTGYSTICMAKSLPLNGLIYTIDCDDEKEEFVRDVFIQSGLSQKINYLIGDALQIIPNLKIQFDLIFIDGDKRQYPEYYKLAIDKLNQGGFILADNILWGGKVIYPEQSNDAYTQAVIEFNNIVHSDTRVENVILPLRDGLMLIRKK